MRTIICFVHAKTFVYRIKERALLLWAIHKENTGNHVPQTVQIELESSTKLVASICYNVSCYSCSVEKIQGNLSKHCVVSCMINTVFFTSFRLLYCIQ